MNKLSDAYNIIRHYSSVSALWVSWVEISNQLLASYIIILYILLLSFIIIIIISPILLDFRTLVKLLCFGASLV